MKVLGLDISANRIAWASSDGSGHCLTDLLRRGRSSFSVFIEEAAKRINGILTGPAAPDGVCLEINLHPNVTHNGHPSATKVRAYMRSRWIEGAIIQECLHEEPQIIERLPGGYYKVPKGTVFALQASGRAGTKEKEDRRRRMVAIYGLAGQTVSVDEIDALATAHEAVIALKTGTIMRGGR